MKLPNIAVLSALIIAGAWSSLSYAGCSAPQMTGIWEVALSDGNSCRIKLKSNGSVDAGDSVCYDPDRGTAGFDSGKIKVQNNCFAEGEVIVGGVTIELPVQFASDRSIAAGRFRVPADGSKGSVVMVRVP